MTPLTKQEQAIEREQVEWVFGLTGGELDDKPLEFTDESGKARSWRYHYNGVPEWAESDFGTHDYFNVDYFTMVETDCCYGSAAPEWLKTSDGKLYVRVEQYTHSGEAECPCGPSGDNEKVGEEHTEGQEQCPLCEAEKGEDHGYIYLGPGCETVYRHIDVVCNECEYNHEEGCICEEE